MSKVYQPQDRYFKKAKDEGFRARSAFKLEEIQNRFHFIKPGDRVLDLGAAPGSFLQLICRIVGVKGLAIGIDLKPIEPLKFPYAKTFESDIFDGNLFVRFQKEFGWDVFDVITSDLAPNTSGIRFMDAGRSAELNERTTALAEKYLRTGGNLLLKLFPGTDTDRLTSRMKTLFREIKVIRPKAVRETSREFYLLGLGKKTSGQ